MRLLKLSNPLSRLKYIILTKNENMSLLSIAARKKYNQLEQVIKKKALRSKKIIGTGKMA